MTARVEVSSSGEIATVAVAGEIDLRTVGIVREALTRVLASGARGVRLDLSQVPFMDSTGMSALVAAYSTGRRSGIPVHISAVHPILRPKLDLAGILPLFEVIEATAPPAPGLDDPRPAGVDG
jgi:anti-anti-sigma factor